MFGCVQHPMPGAKTKSVCACLSYHDIMSLYFCLLCGQLFALQLQTVCERKRERVVLDCWKEILDRFDSTQTCCIRFYLCQANLNECENDFSEECFVSFVVNDSNDSLTILLEQGSSITFHFLETKLLR